MTFSKNLFRLEETFQSIRQHKLRNMAAGFGMAWGIFVLTILLSSGNGLHQGIMKVFSGYGQNTLWIYGGEKSTIAEGQVTGQPILFDSLLLNKIRSRFFHHITALSSEITDGRNALVSNQKESMMASLKGVENDYFLIKRLDLDLGRTFNRLDFMHDRPVCILGQKVKETLFEEGNAIGEYIQYFGNWFQVIGVLSNGSIFNQNEQQVVLIPSTSYQKTFIGSYTFTTFGVKLASGTSAENFETSLTDYLASELDFDEGDKKALFILNFTKQVKAFNKLFNGITIFLWAIGGCLLLSGIVGVINMMMVIVNERTSEIGIRKAIGANDKEILSMILFESTIITLFSGCMGLFMSFLIELGINQLLIGLWSDEDLIIEALSMDFSIAIGAIIALVICGAFAGLFPAMKAVQIMPINALNADK